jgi:hypothetical protein
VFCIGAVLFAFEVEGSADRAKENLEATDDIVDIWRARAGLRETSWVEDDERGESFR